MFNSQRQRSSLNIYPWRFFRTLGTDDEMFTVENVFRERRHFLSGHAVPFRHISFCAGNNPRAATAVTRKSPKFNVFLFLLNALCVGGIVHSDPILKEVGSYYMSLNEYGAPSRFHTAVRGCWNFLDWKFSTEMAWQKRPYHLTGHLVLLTSHPLCSSGVYIKDAVYLDVRPPLLPELAGRIGDVANTDTPPIHTNVWVEPEYTQFTFQAPDGDLKENLYTVKGRSQKYDHITYKYIV